MVGGSLGAPVMAREPAPAMRCHAPTQRVDDIAVGVGTMPPVRPWKQTGSVADRKADVIDHLAGRQLDDDDRADVGRASSQGLGRERPQRDRPEEARLDAAVRARARRRVRATRAAVP